MVNEGHLVCNHTKRHDDLTKLSEDEITKSITELENLYRNCTGRELSKYFRFPEGRYNETALKCVQNLGYKTIFWSFAYADWDNNHQADEEKSIKKILDNTHNGAVILLHPTSKTNANILKTLITKWREMGYTFGTLDELCG
jgi:peptidoglycan-N-acetylmuramic acid deacetylase